MDCGYFRYTEGTQILSVKETVMEFRGLRVVFEGLLV